MSFQDFFIGATQGAFQGVDEGLAFQDKLADVRARNRKEKAAEEIGELFRGAAAKGGLANMDDDFFDKATAAVGATGDYEAAFNIANIGTKLKAQKIQTGARNGSLLIDTGNFEGAVPGINSVLKNIGGGGLTVTGIGATPDGKPAYVLNNGEPLSVEQAKDLLDQTSLAPEDGLKYALEQKKVGAQIALQQAQTGAAESLEDLRRSDQDIQEKKAPLEMNTERAQAGYYGAQASAATELAGQRRSQTPLLADKTRAETEAALERAGASEAQADKSRAGIPVEQARTEKEKALADKARKDSENQFNKDSRGKGAASIYKTNVGEYDKTYTDELGDATDIPPEALTDPYSPILRRATLSEQARVGSKNKNLSAEEVARQAEANVRAVIDVIAENNPDLAQDPEKVATAGALLKTYDSINVDEDEAGEFVVLPDPDSEDGTTKIYLSRKEAAPAQGAAIP